MAKLAEQYVIEQLNREGYATVQGIKKGNNEWDVLAIRVRDGKVEARHVEVQVSFDPVSYLSNPNAKKRTDTEVCSDMEKWIEKKFAGKKIGGIREHFFAGKWSYELVHEVLADPREADFLRKTGVTLRLFTDVIESLCNTHPRKLPFVAEGKDAVEIIRNLKIYD